MAITNAQQARQMYKKGSEKPVEQAGVMNYMPSEMVTVPKIAKSSPDTPTAKLAYITPKEEDILVDLNLYGSLDGKPNRGPGGLPSLEGDFGPGGNNLVVLKVEVEVEVIKIQWEQLTEEQEIIK